MIPGSYVLGAIPTETGKGVLEQNFKHNFGQKWNVSLAEPINNSWEIKIEPG